MVSRPRETEYSLSDVAPSSSEKSHVLRWQQIPGRKAKHRKTLVPLLYRNILNLISKIGVKPKGMKYFYDF